LFPRFILSKSLAKKETNARHQNDSKTNNAKNKNRIHSKKFLMITGVYRSFALAIYGGFFYCATLLLINWAN